MAQLLRRNGVGLPGELTSFVGRRRATTDVKRSLAGSRLITLVGVGGVGKSRLALHVARELRRSYPDGVQLVELANVTDPDLVASAVAEALGSVEHSVRDSETVLVDYLADKRMLLVVDNCEHVLDACAKLLTTLLSAAPELSVLATSREPLGIAAESVYPVAPLSVPGPDTLRSPDGAPSGEPVRSYEAVALFAERAAAVSPGFSITPENEAAVVRLCQRLDGVPLALELAAVRVRVLSVEQILSRLDRRFELLTTGNRAGLPRHQTLRAAVDWSYELCTEQERLLWARCSVFAGEFDLDAAENVCAGDGLSADDVLTGIAGLVDKSLLNKISQGTFVRYSMLETIRQYGCERLADIGERDVLRRRHRDYYLRLAERVDADSCGPRQAELVRLLRGERSNLLAALEYCLTVPGEGRLGLRMAGALWFYWVVCGFVRDGRYWLERALAVDGEPSSERARALWLTGWLAYFQADNASGIELTSRARELALQLADDTELAYANEFLAGAYSFAGDYARAMTLFDEALALYQKSGQWTSPALMTFGGRARASVLLGDSADAVTLLKQGEQACAALGESWALSWLKWNLAVIRWREGKLDEVGEPLREALRMKRDLDDQVGIPFCLDLLAALACRYGDAHRAAVLFGAADTMWQRVGGPLFGNQTLLDYRQQAIQQSQTSLGAEAFDLAWREGAAMSGPAVIAAALGERTGSPDEDDSSGQTAPKTVLTKRELQVAELVAAGKSNREIAGELVISQRTAESHIDHILSKLGFNSRTQIAVWYADQQGV